jgi:hypothetical protein
MDFDRSAELYKKVNKMREGLTFKFCECFGACELISLDDFASLSVEAHQEKVLRFLEQFSCEDDGHVRRVAHLDLRDGHTSDS